MRDKITVEVALEQLDHALFAEELGADRIELCANLIEGGTTPSHGMIKACKEALNIPIHVMIRPRAGNFNYSKEEILVMKEDIRACADLGIRGVVFGCLNEDLSIDKDQSDELFSLSNKLGLKVSHHRAFDVCSNKREALDFFRQMPMENLLTSGGAIKAPLGIDYIQELHQKHGDHFNILVGCGVNADNVLHFIEAGIRNVHFTSHHYITDKVNDAFDFGSRAIYNREFTKNIIDVLPS